VSHELRTPITSIKGFVETLIDGALHDPKDAERFLAIIAKQADRLNAIVEDLLSLARIEEDAEKEKVHRARSKVLDVLRDAVLGCETKASEKNISINLDCSTDLVADIDPQLIEQAVVNLIDNAVKYSEPGGRVSVGAAVTGSSMTISVSDEGCGIEEKHLPRLFERFYRVDRARSRELGGTGLGLAIVKHISQAHGGRVTVQSVAGRGSTFTIHIPNR
jgi:two-component system phosphate regulon sensor histidine kinase PhoR